MADILTTNVPAEDFKLKGEPEETLTPSNRSLAAFKTKVEGIIAVQKREKTTNKDKKKVERIAQQESWRHSIKRIQRYMGIRQCQNSSDAADLAAFESLSIEADGDKKGAAAQPALSTSTIDPTKPAPFDPEGSVVFVCVDVEAYERPPRPITEVGVATLDTLDLKGLAPGENGKDWLGKIRARHFRIEETKLLENTEYVRGCADRFEFGYVL